MWVGVIIFQYIINLYGQLCWLTSKGLHQLWVETGCSLEELLQVMDDLNGWQERESQVLYNSQGISVHAFEFS